jgi:hypothetical protein
MACVVSTCARGREYLVVSNREELYDRTSKCSPDIASSDADGTDRQKAELAIKLLFVSGRVDHLAHTDGIVERCQARLLLLIATHLSGALRGTNRPGDVQKQRKLDCKSSLD